MEIQNRRGISMKKILLESDSIVIDGMELTYAEIQEKIKDSSRYRNYMKYSDFIRAGGVLNE